MATIKEMVNGHFKLTKQLNEVNKLAYEDIERYLRSSSLSGKEVDELLADVLDMLLDAQHRGESATTIFGEDLQQFCDELITSNGKPNRKKKLQEYVSFLIGGFLFLFAINYLFIQLSSILKNKQDWLTVHLYLDVTVQSFLCFGSIFVANYLGQKVFKINNKKITDMAFIFAFSFTIATIGTFTDYDKVILFSFPLYIAFPIIILLGFLSIKLYK